MTRSVNVAVIGTGYWGKKVVYEYLQLARSNQNVNLSMVCDLRNENLAYCREVYGVPTKSLTKDYREILRSEVVDAVHICIPNEKHYQICKDFLGAGKHVLIEKPMTLNARHAYELVEVSELKSLILQVGHIYRFNNALNKVLRLIEESYFGDIYYLKLQWTTLMNPPPARDIIFDLAPHPIDILNYLLDRWPVRISCRARAYRREHPEEIAYIIAEFDGKLIAQIELSWLQPKKVRQVSVIGSRRCATIDCLDQIVQVYDNHSGKLYNLNVHRNNTLLTEISHFTGCILNGGEYFNSGLVGARNVEVLECIRKSLDEGIVDIPQYMQEMRSIRILETEV